MGDVCAMAGNTAVNTLTLSSLREWEDRRRAWTAGLRSRHFARTHRPELREERTEALARQMLEDLQISNADTARRAHENLQELHELNPERARAYLEESRVLSDQVASIPMRHDRNAGTLTRASYGTTPAAPAYRPIRFQCNYVAQEASVPEPSWRNMLRYGF